MSRKKDKQYMGDGRKGRWSGSHTGKTSVKSAQNRRLKMVVESEHKRFRELHKMGETGMWFSTEKEANKFAEWQKKYIEESEHREILFWTKPLSPFQDLENLDKLNTKECVVTAECDGWIRRPIACARVTEKLSVQITPFDPLDSLEVQSDMPVYTTILEMGFGLILDEIDPPIHLMPALRRLSTMLSNGIVFEPGEAGFGKIEVCKDTHITVELFKPLETIILELTVAPSPEELAEKDAVHTLAKERRQKCEW